MKMVIEYIGGSPLSDDVITIKKKEKREDFSELELSSKEVQGEFIHLCTEFISKGPEAGFELAELSSVIFK